MNKIFGDYLEQLSEELDALEMSFKPYENSIRRRWQNNRLSAQFIAEYFSAFLPVAEDDPEGTKRIESSKGAISYVANELIENAMKFSDRHSNFKVKFGVYFLGDKTENSEVVALLFATNSVTASGMAKFETFLHQLLVADPEEFYVSQVEKSMESEHDEASGLGFLTMINDYGAKLGWKFETIEEPPLHTVTTMARITV